MKTLDIFGTIGDIYEGVTDRQIAGELEGVEAGDLTVRINSPGGLADMGAAIYNLLEPLAPRVEVVGLAASAASIIAMAGREVAMARGSSLMIHEAWGVTMGDAKAHDDEAKVLRKLNSRLSEIYAGRRGVSQAQAREWMKAETWFTAEEAVAAGLADTKAESKAAAHNRDQVAALLRKRDMKSLAESWGKRVAQSIDTDADRRRKAESRERRLRLVELGV